MKKLLGILVLGLLWCNVSYAWCFLNCKREGVIFSVFDEDKKFEGFSSWDPDVSGCVYDSWGESRDCVSIKYNEAKLRGSYEDARRQCEGILRGFAREEQLQNYTIEGCIDYSPGANRP